MNATPTAIVTGASHGFGELTAQTLARRGHRVFAGMRDMSTSNALAVARLRALAASEELELDPIELDVTDDASVAGAVERVLDQAGRIDVVVNNAGVLFVGITEAFTVDQVREQLDVNVLGAMRMNRAALPSMRRGRSGLLVHVSSIAARLTWPFYGLYCASKQALEALAEAHRYELCALGVDSVIVEPGPYPTHLLAALRRPADRDCASSYGQTAEIGTTLITGLEEMLAGEDAPDPQQVADAIAELAKTPIGQRPLRTVVGSGFGAEEINEATAPFAQGALEAFGLAELAGAGPRYAARGVGSPAAS